MDKFKQGDKIVWDSGFGYDKGIFVKYVSANSFNFYPTATIKVSGREINVTYSEVYKRTELQRIRKKYK